MEEKRAGTGRRLRAVKGRLLQWGAGNIGRGFIGQIFARNGYEVIFIDINTPLVESLNRAGEYRLIELSSDGEKEIRVGNISAIDGRDEESICRAVAHTDYLATSVGQAVLPKIAPSLARAISYRYNIDPHRPLDIIIAENVSRGGELMASLLRPHLPPDFPMDSYLGFVETSLGKMVPIQSGADPLRVYAEPFNTLILDLRGFKGAVPEAPEIRAVEPIEAYVAEKLYIHNLGHASAAYFGQQFDQSLQFIWQVMELPRLREKVKAAMEEAGAALRAEFPELFTVREIDDHIDDLLYRFGNRALGDTIYRVGRDLKRKLHREDRLMGAILLAERHKLPWDHIGRAWLAALEFRGRDEAGELFPPDEVFLKQLSGLNRKRLYTAATGFTADDEISLESAGELDAVIAKLESLSV
jgi:mannitol-1-phosphate 5-dehydrogenase